MSHSHPAGFKHIGNTALNLVAQGFEVPFGYEEAIGYMFGSDIRDKDGVAASVCFFPPKRSIFSALTCIRFLLHNLLQIFMVKVEQRDPHSKNYTTGEATTSNLLIIVLLSFDRYGFFKV